jgi:hypothetical protein
LEKARWGFLGGLLSPGLRKALCALASSHCMGTHLPLLSRVKYLLEKSIRNKYFKKQII